MQKKKFKVTPLERAWILYDVGNSAFVLMIATLVPIFFNALAEAGGVSKVNYLAYWGYASSVVTVVTAVLGPILGTLADTKNFKKPIFMLCLFVGVLGCCAMGAARTWLPFLVIFIVAKIGFSGSLVFYDSMLGDVTTPERMDMVSSRGYAWGYIGSCVPFVVCLALVLGSGAIGMSQMTALTIALFITAAWWLVTTLPLLRRYRQVNYVEVEQHAIRQSFVRIGHTLKHLYEDKQVFWFLLAFFCYIDGVYTIIDMATAYGTALGLDTTGLLLALLLSLTGCFTITGDTTDTSPEGKQEEPEEQHLTADVDETQVWQRTAGAPWTGGEPQTVSADFERISGAAAQGMTVGQELLLLDFMDCYYQSIADLRVIDPAVLFADSEETLYHKNIWHGLCVIRKLSPIDLTMTSYSYSLRCVSITPSEETEGDVDLVLRENNVAYFKGLNGLPSEQFGIKHTFTLRGEGDDWSIVKHWSDDNPYYSADYDRTTHQDKNFPAITDYIEGRRDLTREGLSVTAAADHPYDRDAARAYMLTWVGKRNPAFMAYDDYGGNCMNFGSQVLAAGGIPMDTNGGYETGWYWYSASQTTLPWVNVGSFRDYVAAPRVSGLVAVADAPYFSGETGDIITMGVDEPANHTTVILDAITDENGNVVDYLLCSNTADLRNFPASAYYYTNRQLIRIIGWND